MVAVNPRKDSLNPIDRLVSLSDAVISIAVTLLILPLVDRASAINVTSWSGLTHATGQQFIIFLISFVVICRLWLVHHGLFRSVEKFDRPLFWLNAFWLLTIVVIPFPTELIGRTSDTSSLILGLYIGTLLVNSLTSFFLQWYVRRSSHLQKRQSSTTSLAVPAATVILMLFALVISTTIPSVGPWSLLLLVMSDQLSGVLQRKTSL